MPLQPVIIIIIINNIVGTMLADTLATLQCSGSTSVAVVWAIPSSPGKKSLCDVSMYIRAVYTYT